MFHVKMLCAGAFWMLAVTLMVVATGEGLAYLRSWALLAALIAWLPTHSLFACHERERLSDEVEQMLMLERRRTERLVQALAVEMAEADVAKIAHHSRV